MAAKTTWEIADHVCKVCCGRVLARRNDDGDRVFRCSNCGVEASGKSSAVVCCCGIKINGKDGGIRCVINGQKSPLWPSEFVAEQVAANQK